MKKRRVTSRTAQDRTKTGELSREARRKRKPKPKKPRKKPLQDLFTAPDEKSST